MSPSNSSDIGTLYESTDLPNSSINEFQTYAAIKKEFGESGESRSGSAAYWEKAGTERTTTITFHPEPEETSRLSEFAKRKEVGSFDVGNGDKITFFDGPVHRTADERPKSTQDALNIFWKGK